MKLEDFADITCDPSIIYVYNIEGKALLKTSNTNIKSFGICNKEIIKIKSDGLSFRITIKEN